MNAANKMLQVARSVARTVRNDGWFNVLTGLGIQGKDKSMSMEYQWLRYNESSLEHLYAVDATARRIVDYVPDEATREWIEFKMSEGDNKDPVKFAVEEFERLCAQHKFRDAFSWARLYGGAGLLVSVDDGKNLDEPLILEDIRSVRSLTLLNRFELPTAKIITDLESPDFGKQEVYDISPRATVADGRKAGQYGMGVHHTRVIRFDGLPLPRRLFEQNDNWGDSVLPKILQALRNYNSSHNSLSSALSDFRFMIVKLNKLADMVGSDDDQALLARLQLMNISKSVMGCVAIDAEKEDVSHLETNFANLDKVIEKVESRLVADSDLPHTVVLGEGAQGTLGGGGESEDDNAKDFVAGQQEMHLTRPINRLLEIVMAAKLGPFRGKEVEDLSWQFKPLWQMSEQEKANLHKTQAEADAIYLDRQVTSPENIAQSRWGSGEYSTETAMEEAFNESSGPSNKPNPSSEEPNDANASKADDVDKVSFDHAHSGWIERVGYYYTSGANGDGDNHTHQLPNGTDTGPAIPLFGGGHMHNVDHENYTGPAFPLAMAREAEAVVKEAEEASKPAVIELELDIKTGKLIMKGVSMDRFYDVSLNANLLKADEIEALKKRFPECKPTENPTLDFHPTNMKGVKVWLRKDA